MSDLYLRPVRRLWLEDDLSHGNGATGRMIVKTAAETIRHLYRDDTSVSAMGLRRAAEKAELVIARGPDAAQGHKTQEDQDNGFGNRLPTIVSEAEIVLLRELLAHAAAQWIAWKWNPYWDPPYDEMGRLAHEDPSLLEVTRDRYREEIPVRVLLLPFGQRPEARQALPGELRSLSDDRAEVEDVAFDDGRTMHMESSRDPAAPVNPLANRMTKKFGIGGGLIRGDVWISGSNADLEPCDIYDDVVLVAEKIWHEWINLQN